MKKKEKAKKDLWFVPAELPHDTLFMMSIARFFTQEWPKLGLGNKIKVYFSYFKGDFCQMWYKRKEFDAEAEFLAKKMIRNPYWALKMIDKVEEWSKKFIAESKRFCKLSFSKMEVKDMFKAYRKVVKWHELSHGVGGSISWLADADKERVTKAIMKVVAEQIKKKKLNLELANVFSLLSTPASIDEQSFAIREEKELLKIAQKIFGQKKIKGIFKKTKLKSLERKIKETNSPIFSLLYAHFQKWRWLAYGYKGPAYSFNYFLERWQGLVQQNISPTKLLKEISAKEKKVKQEQNKLLKKLKFNSYQLKLIKLAQRIIFIKEFRKGALYHGCYCYEPFFQEVAKRLNLTLEYVWAMSIWEIEECLRKNKAPKKELETRLKEAVAYIDRKRYTIWGGKKAHSFFIKIPKEKAVPKEEVKELSGTCASPGYAKGIVKIIETPEDMPKMKQGNILVSETTYPSLVPAMKKAAAIVTNAGGLTCHAAIVSREFGIPCVVGTKIANKVLKDGDQIEVDATHGIVKKL